MSARARGQYGVTIGVYLTGVKELERRVALMDKRVQARVRVSVRRGTEAIEAGARQRAPVKTGELMYSIRSEYTKDKLTGYVKAGYGKLLRRSRAVKDKEKLRYQGAKSRREERRLQLRLAQGSKQALTVADLGVYAPVVEHGDPRRNKPKRAFMYPSFEAEVPAIHSALLRDIGVSANEVTR